MLIISWNQTVHFERIFTRVIVHSYFIPRSHCINQKDRNERSSVIFREMSSKEVVRIGIRLICDHLIMKLVKKNKENVDAGGYDHGFQEEIT